MANTLRAGYAALNEGALPSIPVMLNIYVALNKPFRRKKKAPEEHPEREESVVEESITEEEEEILDYIVNSEEVPEKAT